MRGPAEPVGRRREPRGISQWPCEKPPRQCKLRARHDGNCRRLTVVQVQTEFAVAQVRWLRTDCSQKYARIGASESARIHLDCTALNRRCIRPLSLKPLCTQHSARMNAAPVVRSLRVMGTCCPTAASTGLPSKAGALTHPAGTRDHHDRVCSLRLVYDDDETKGSVHLFVQDCIEAREASGSVRTAGPKVLALLRQ